MQWDQEDMNPALPVKAYRPVVMDVIIGPARRFRHPAVQAEIERRIAVYAQQVEQTGRITWLPRRGSGG